MKTAKYKLESGDHKVYCYENDKLVRVAILTSPAETDKYIECWTKNIKYIFEFKPNNPVSMV